MSTWIVFGVVLALVGLARADSRDRTNRPTRSWNIWFGPKPREGESRARYTLGRAIVALATLVILAVPLVLVSAPPDEGTSFSGEESIFGMAVFMIFAPLAAMTVVAFVALLSSALLSAIFRSDHFFDGAAGEFVRRSFIRRQPARLGVSSTGIDIDDSATERQQRERD